MHHMLDSAARIVARGQDAFTDPADDTQYLAAKALIIDLQSAADRLSESFRAAHAEIPWRQLGRTRDRLGHHYLGIDKVVIWRVLAMEFPRIRAGLVELSGQ